jgi:hypothetical protein
LRVLPQTLSYQLALQIKKQEKDRLHQPACRTRDDTLNNQDLKRRELALRTGPRRLCGMNGHASVWLPERGSETATCGSTVRVVIAC